jgi:hypothetical protein
MRQRTESDPCAVERCNTHHKSLLRHQKQGHSWSFRLPFLDDALLLLERSLLCTKLVILSNVIQINGFSSHFDLVSSQSVENSEFVKNWSRWSACKSSQLKIGSNIYFTYTTAWHSRMACAIKLAGTPEPPCSTRGVEMSARVWRSNRRQSILGWRTLYTPWAVPTETASASTPV